MIRLKTVSLLRHKSELSTLPDGKLLINTINAHSYNNAQKDPLFAEALLRGGALIPDGESIVLAFRWLRHEHIERIPGWDLFEHEMERLNQKGGTCFFLGASEKTLQLIKEKARVVYPHITVETYSPPYKPEFSDEDNHAMIDAVNRVKPDLLWVGMTAPKQEKWAYTHYDELDVKGHIGTIGAVGIRLLCRNRRTGSRGLAEAWHGVGLSSAERTPTHVAALSAGKPDFPPLHDKREIRRITLL